MLPHCSSSVEGGLGVNAATLLKQLLKEGGRKRAATLLKQLQKEGGRKRAATLFKQCRRRVGVNVLHTAHADVEGGWALSPKPSIYLNILNIENGQQI